MERIMDQINQVVLVIIGVDFGDVNIDLFGGDFIQVMSILFMMPSLASLLPAAVFGFIANFVLEEKFELKCDGIGENDCAVQTEIGCCDIISSHELNNTYEFAGGLASNIIATWAVIRIFGYFFVHA